MRWLLGKLSFETIQVQRVIGGLTLLTTFVVSIDYVVRHVLEWLV